MNYLFCTVERINHEFKKIVDESTVSSVQLHLMSLIALAHFLRGLGFGEDWRVHC